MLLSAARGRRTDGGTRGCDASSGGRRNADECGDDRAAVVIVGGGPTGLMLADELALAGVEVAIVERRAAPSLSMKPHFPCF